LRTRNALLQVGKRRCHWNMKTRILRWVGIAMAVALLGFVGPSASAQQVFIGFAQCALNAPYYVAMERAANETAKKLGAKLTLLNSDNDVSKQIDQVNNLLVQGINGLVINSDTEYGTEPVIKEVTARGIPVVAIDRNLYGDYIAYVGIDQWKAGVLQGQFISQKLLPKGGNLVLLMGDPGDPANIGRMNGMLSVLNAPENKGKYTILGQYAAFYNQSQGLSKMEEAIAAFSNKIDLVYAANDAMGLGALQALQEANLKNVMICSVDGQKEAYQEILKGGQYKSTIVNNSWDITRIAVRVLYNYLTTHMTPAQTVEQIKKDDPELGATVYMKGDKDIITGTVLVNASNVKKFYKPDSVF
jgi:ABC-type sugar transport system substrate-binding protein